MGNVVVMHDGGCCGYPSLCVLSFEDHRCAQSLSPNEESDQIK